MITQEQRAELDTCVKGLHDGANITMDAGTIRSLIAALEEAEAHNKDWRKLWVKQQGQRWQAIETLNATRKQLAEAQADNANIHSAAHRLAIESECFWMDCKDMPTQSKWMDPMLDAIGQVQALRWRGDTSALQSAIAEAVEPYRKDAERYQWLTGDHAKHDTRAKVYEIASAMNVRGKGSTDAAIDAALAAKEAQRHE